MPEWVDEFVAEGCVYIIRPLCHYEIDNYTVDTLVSTSPLTPVNHLWGLHVTHAHWAWIYIIIKDLCFLIELIWINPLQTSKDSNNHNLEHSIINKYRQEDTNNMKTFRKSLWELVKVGP